jgi:4-aminobutyrate aminotransferase-like enzyme
LPNAPSVAYAAVTHPIPGPAQSSKTRETIALAKDYVLPVYARSPIVLERGKGSWVWDYDGRKYLDFTAGIAVNALGHADEGVSEAGYRLLPKHVAHLGPGKLISDPIDIDNEVAIEQAHACLELVL